MNINVIVIDKTGSSTLILGEKHEHWWVNTWRVTRRCHRSTPWNRLHNSSIKHLAPHNMAKYSQKIVLKFFFSAEDYWVLNTHMLRNNSIASSSAMNKDSCSFSLSLSIQCDFPHTLSMTHIDFLIVDCSLANSSFYTLPYLSLDTELRCKSVSFYFVSYTKQTFSRTLITTQAWLSTTLASLCTIVHTQATILSDCIVASWPPYTRMSRVEVCCLLIGKPFARYWPFHGNASSGNWPRVVLSFFLRSFTSHNKGWEILTELKEAGLQGEWSSSFHWNSIKSTKLQPQQKSKFQTFCTSFLSTSSYALK